MKSLKNLFIFLVFVFLLLLPSLFDLPWWVILLAVAVGFSLWAWQKLARAGAYVGYSRRLATHLQKKRDNAAARNFIADMRRIGLLTNAQAASLLAEFGDPSETDTSATVQPPAELTEYTRPVLDPEDLKSVNFWVGKLMAGKSASQALRLTVMENIRLTKEVNDHRAARGFKPLPTFK
jgi:uncharacterized protein YbaA (DUF1428 family)